MSSGEGEKPCRTGSVARSGRFCRVVWVTRSVDSAASWGQTPFVRGPARLDVAIGCWRPRSRRSRLDDRDLPCPNGVVSSQTQPRSAAVPVTRHIVRGKGSRARPSVPPPHRSLRRRAAPLRGPRVGFRSRRRPRRAHRVRVPRGCRRPRALRGRGQRRRHRPPSIQRGAARGAPGRARAGGARHRAGLVYRRRSGRGAGDVRSVPRRRARLLRPGGPHARLSARARAHAARAHARPGRRGGAGRAAARRIRPRPPARAIRGPVRRRVRDGSRHAVRGRGGSGRHVSRVPAAAARRADGIDHRVRLRAGADRGGAGRPRHHPVRRSGDARSIRDGRPEARCARAARRIRSDGAQALPLRDPSTAGARRARRRAPVFGARRRARVRRDRAADPGRSARRRALRRDGGVRAVSARLRRAHRPRVRPRRDSGVVRSGHRPAASRRAARSSRCSGARSSGCPRRASRSTSRCPRCPTRRRPATQPSIPPPADDLFSGFTGIDAPADEPDFPLARRAVVDAPRSRRSTRNRQRSSTARCARRGNGRS